MSWSPLPPACKGCDYNEKQRLAKLARRKGGGGGGGAVSRVDAVMAILLMLVIVGCRKEQPGECLSHGYPHAYSAWNGQDWVWYCSRRGPAGDEVVSLASLEAR
jgi:hypothetical protein